VDGLVGKRALVTGAAAGIGRACAIALAEAGTWVACADIADAAATAEAIGGLGQKASAMVCDVADETSVLDLFGEVKRQARYSGPLRRSDA
jgi:NAD(P)-dependent dehydrogenase (short-subunit alcohol dehydrogenase family)